MEKNLPRGFSLIELIMIILLLGIISVVALPRLFQRSVFEERGFLEDAAFAIRYAQKLAVGSGCDVQVSFTATGYTLNRRAAGCTLADCTGCAFTGDVNHPASGGLFTNTAPSGVTLSAATFYFDKVGRPVDTGDSLITTTTDISVNTETITVEPVTGFTHYD